MRFMKMIVTVPEESVGSIIADITGRVTSIAFETVEIVDKRVYRPTKKTKSKQRLSDRIIEQLQSGPKGVQELKETLDANYGSISAVLNQMKKENKVKPDKETHKWSLT